MSTILHRRECHIAISAYDAGVEFMCAPFDVQAEFFRGMGAAWLNQDVGTWPKRCEQVAAELSQISRTRLRNIVDSLASKLKEREVTT